MVVHGRLTHGDTWETYTWWYMGDLRMVIHGRLTHGGTWETYTWWYREVPIVIHGKFTHGCTAGLSHGEKFGETEDSYLLWYRELSCMVAKRRGIAMVEHSSLFDDITKLYFVGWGSICVG